MDGFHIHRSGYRNTLFGEAALKEAKKISNKWLGFVCAVWIICIFWASSYEGYGSSANPDTEAQWAGAKQESTLEYLMDVKNIVYSTIQSGATSFTFVNTEYWTTLWNVITWKQFTFLNGQPWEMIRWIVLIPFSIAAVFGIVYMFIVLLTSLVHA